MTTLSRPRIEPLTVDGQAAFRLDNGLAQADVLPGLGGKIWNLRDLARGVQWIWHNPKVPLGPVEPGAAYDDHWAGGWEELFPNDAPGPFEGRDLEDHGEWWSRPWRVEGVEDSDRGAALRLSLEGRAPRSRCLKTIELTAGEPRLTVRYRIENLESEAVRFLLKEHLAVAVTPRHRIELPGGRVTPVDLSFSARLGGPGPFDWPTGRDKAGGPVDLGALPEPGERLREFVYVEGLPEGWCGVRDAGTGARLRLRFPIEVFPFVWLFCDFGGWRGLYTVVLEPCTNMPKDLGEAARLKRCGALGPGEAIECSVAAELS